MGMGGYPTPCPHPTSSSVHRDIPPQHELSLGWPPPLHLPLGIPLGRPDSRPVPHPPGVSTSLCLSLTPPHLQQIAIESLRDDYTTRWDGLMYSAIGSVYQQEFDMEGTSFALFIVNHLMPRVLGTVREGYTDFIPLWRDALLYHLYDDEYSVMEGTYHQRALPLEVVMGECGLATEAPSLPPPPPPSPSSPHGSPSLPVMSPRLFPSLFVSQA
jgi:hypothetical protein